MERAILLLGEERLYQKSSPVEQVQLPELAQTIEDLHDTLLAYRTRYGAGRAIAAPQIGVFSRLIYCNIDHPVVLINPELMFPDSEQMDMLDDCMSFPGLLVWVRRFCRCVVTYQDETFAWHRWALEGDLSELIQHEYDHLDGILATQRAANDRALVYRRLEGTKT